MDARQGTATLSTRRISAKVSTKHLESLESRLEVIQGHAFWDD